MSDTTDVKYPRFFVPTRKKKKPGETVGELTGYKYFRRVPLHVQPVIGETKWEHRLGVDLDKALEKWAILKREHDELITQLKTPEGVEQFQQREQDVGLAKAVEFALAVGPRIGMDVKVDAPVWRHTEDKLASVRGLPDERDILATFAAYAFGDHSHLQRKVADDPVGMALATHARPARPDGVAGQMFDLSKGLVEERIYALEGEKPLNPAHKLSALRERYIEMAKSAPTTARGMRTKTNRLIDFAGDLPIGRYSVEKLKDYRDYLMEEDLKADSVRAYFASVKTIMNWAEEEVPGFEINTANKVRMPKDGETVEDKRWVRFEDDQIGAVWKAVNDAWGPSSKSKLSDSRKAAFLMVFRVLLWTGMRPNEVFALRTHGAVKKDMIEIRKTKTRRTRDLPLSIHISDFHDFMQNDGFGDCDKKDIHGVMSEHFTKIITDAGLRQSDKQVLYSLKDTLVSKIQRLPEVRYTDDLIRAVIGHVGQGELRHYKTRRDEDREGFEEIRRTLDAVTYW